MTHPRLIQELVICLGRGAPHQFLTRDGLTHQLQAQVPEADVRSCQEAICRAVTLGVLGHVGAHYLVRRPVTALDTQRLMGCAPSPLALALSAQVQSLKAVAAAPRPIPPLHPWLTLHPDRTPESLRMILTAQASEALGADASPEDLRRMMHILAAKALLHLLTPEEPT